MNPNKQMESAVKWLFVICVILTVVYLSVAKMTEQSTERAVLPHSRPHGLLPSEKSPGVTGSLSAPGGYICPEMYIRELQQYMIDSGIKKVKVNGEWEVLKVDGRWGDISEGAYCILKGIESMRKAGQ